MFTRKMLVGLMAVLAVGVMSATPAAAQVNKTQAVADWKVMDRLCTQYQRTFLSESEAKKMGPSFKTEWETWKKEFVPAWESFSKKYGADHRAVGKTFEGIEKPDGVSNDAWMVANIAVGIDVSRQEAQFADWAVGWAKDALRVATGFKGENLEQLERKLIRAEDAVRYFKLAKTWNPKGDYDESMKQAEAIVKEVTPQWKKALSELKWPGHSAEFAGPGKPDELAAAALELLRKKPDWTKPEYDDEHVPFAACVTAKGWEVWKKAPLTEQPTQYCTELLVAFTGKADPDLVYCYRMVFYTKEEAGVKPELPFHYANSKQYACFRMLKANVPGK